VPGYEIEGILGRGGMGVVYKAQQTALKRTVALKMILGGGPAGEEQRTRFKAEAEAVARLRHPHIVQVYEVGEHQGLPYCALEFVEGGSLARKLAGKPLPPGESARLVATLAGAMHLAHSRNVVHRDLKPANVLLTADGQPKVTDFGLARLLDAEPGLTRSGAVMGTPSYMAPEQATGQASAAGPPADVYALGAILYECLTGRVPFLGGNTLETLEQVRTREPVAPSRLQPAVPLDLETICLKCLAKEPEKRYPSAQELADDLERFGRGEPVTARPVGALERAWRWCRRNRAVAGLGAAVVLLLVGAAVVSPVVAVHFIRLAGEREHARIDTETAGTREKEARTQAERQRDRAERAFGISTLAQALSAWNAGDVPLSVSLAEEVAPEARFWEWRHLRRRFAGTPFTILGQSGGITKVAWSPDGQLLASGAADGSVRLRDAATGAERSTLQAHKGRVYGLGFSPDGSRLATAGADGVVGVWDPRTGGRLGAWKSEGGAIYALDWAPVIAHAGMPNRCVATASADGRVRLWDADAGTAVQTIAAHPGPVLAVAFSPDGRWLASAGDDHQVRLWDAASGGPVRALAGHQDKIGAVAFSPDGRLLAAGGADLFIRLWDPRSGQVVRDLDLYSRAEPPDGWRYFVTDLSFRPDGARLASCCGGYAATRVGGPGVDRSVRIWDVDSGRQVASCKGPYQASTCVRYSPDGGRLAAGSSAGEAGRWRGDLRVWDVRAEGDHRLLLGHQFGAKGVAFCAGGKHLASAAGNPLFPNKGELKVWDPATGALLFSRTPPSVLMAIRSSPDGSTLATGTEAGTIELWDADGQPLGTLRGAGSPIHDLCYHPDGKHLASAGLDGTLCVWDLERGEVQSRSRRPGLLDAVCYNADGTLLAVAAGLGGPGEVLLWDRPTEGEPAVLGSQGQWARGVCFSPDGKRLAWITFAGLVRVWDVARRRELLAFQAHGTGRAIAYSPDGRRLATSGGDRRVRLWDAETGREVLSLEGPEEPGASLVFSRDGRWLATNGDNRPLQNQPAGEVRLWDAGPARSSRNLSLPEPAPGGVPEPVAAVWFSPDGRRLQARGSEGTVAAWSVPEGQPVEAGPVPSGAARPLAFSPDGDFEAAGHPGGSVELVDLRPTSQDLAERQALARLDAAWHVHQARLAFRWDRPFATAFHARQALRGPPADPETARLALDGQLRVAEEWRRLDDPRAAEAGRELRRLAEAVAELRPHDPDSRRIVAAVLLAPAWTIREPERPVSAGGADLTVQPDGSVLASGRNPEHDTYTLRFRSPLAGITGLRLEVLPDRSLPQNGAGRGPDGNFELSEMTLAVAAPGEAEGKPIPPAITWALYNGRADQHYLKKDMRPEWAIDGDPKTFWNSWPAVAFANRLVVQTREPAGKTGDALTVRLDFQAERPRHALGRFRLAVTNAPRPAVVERWRAELPNRPVSTWTVVAVSAWLRGDWAGVVSACDKARALPQGETAFDAALLAVAQERMGNREAGRAALGRARRLAGKGPADGLLAELLEEATGSLEKTRD
jgi:WD40 repeat protein